MTRHIITLLLVTTASFAEEKPITPESRGYKLTWSDEFDGTALDTAKWHTDYAPKVHPLGTNNERQAYAPENAIVKDGHLILRAERRETKRMPFTSGMVSSHDKFSQQYGWFEARIQVPKGRGLWPAWWMLPVSKKWPPEIDIMEHKGRLPNRVFLTLHEPLPNTWRPKSTGKEWDGPDFTAGFHTFAVEWEANALRWFVDGVERHTFAKPTPDQPFYLILNFAVGGMFDGDVDAATPFPSEMRVDWVRVFAKP